jgi:putative endonuclease
MKATPHRALAETRGESAGPDPDRRRRWRRGRWAERFAALALMLKGYRVLARSVRTPLGEIDIVAVRGRRIAFFEVKRRATRAEAEAAIGIRQRQRVRRAADLWIARNRKYAEHERGFDLVFVLPRRWPQHLKNAL